jgi:hypothetical protein
MVLVVGKGNDARFTNRLQDPCNTLPMSFEPTRRPSLSLLLLAGPHHI